MLQQIRDFVSKLLRAGIPINQQALDVLMKNEQVAPPAPKVVSPYNWTTPELARHSVRVICDEEGLTLQQKNVICACIEQESGFNNSAICRNRRADGSISSSDWGICQINDYWQVKPRGSFLSVGDIVDHPEKAVRFMIAMYKAKKLDLWVSYSSGAYKKYMPKL